MLDALLDAWAVVTLLYFLLLGAMSLVFTIVAWVSLRRFERSRHYFPADEAFASPLTPGVSIILPASTSRPEWSRACARCSRCATRRWRSSS